MPGYPVMPRPHSVWPDATMPVWIAFNFPLTSEYINNGDPLSPVKRTFSSVN